MRCLHEQRLCGHDHAVGAVSALCGLLGNERGLNWIGLLGRAKSLESRNQVA